MKLDNILHESYTKEFIKSKLETDDNWVMRAILAIHKFQTSDERVSHATRELNGVGFSGVDAAFLSSLAEQLLKQREQGRPYWLSPKQLAIARNKIKKYSGQLAKIANATTATATT